MLVNSRSQINRNFWSRPAHERQHRGRPSRFSIRSFTINRLKRYFIIFRQTLKTRRFDEIAMPLLSGNRLVRPTSSAVFYKEKNPFYKILYTLRFRQFIISALKSIRTSTSWTFYDDVHRDADCGLFIYYYYFFLL